MKFSREFHIGALKEELSFKKFGDVTATLGGKLNIFFNNKFNEVAEGDLGERLQVSEPLNGC